MRLFRRLGAGGVFVVAEFLRNEQSRTRQPGLDRVIQTHGRRPALPPSRQTRIEKENIMNLHNTLIATIVAFSIAGTATAQPTRQAFVEDMFAAFNAHDVERLKTFYADDAIVYAPESCEPTIGRDAIGASYAEMFAHISDVHDELETVVTEGSKTAVIFTASSDAPGAAFQLPIAAFLTIEDGLIVEDRVFFNSDMDIDCSES